jgi:hypothetical protein
MADMSIQSAYERVLGRAPSADEVAYWQEAFGNSVDPVELSTFSVAAQPELAAAAPTNTAVRDMYQQVLGRAPDASGLQYFAERFGTSIDPTELGIFQSMAAEEIAANAARNAAQQAAAAANTTTTTDDSAGIQVVVFGPDGTPYGSPAAAARAGVTNYTMENPATTAATTAATGMSIADAYQRVLGRAPSASEIAYWTSQFGSDVDPTELSTFSVAAQPERAAAPTTNDAIRQMYLSVLGREPDASGLQYFADRFGTEVDASELGIFKGMATQEINANAARNAGTTTGTGTTAGTTTGTGTAGTVQPITRPTAQRQVTGTQLAPARVTNTAITGTPFRNIYTPSTMQQNAPTLAQINAASQSANPYQSLMALTPQRTLSPAYAAQAGQTTANTNLGGFNPAVYKPPAATTTTGGGLLTTAESPAGGENTSTGTGMAGINNQAALSAALSNLGFAGLGQGLATSVGNQLGSLTMADILGGNIAGVNTGGFPEGYIDPGDYEGGLGSSAGMGGLTGPNYSDYGGMAGETGGGDTMGFGGEYAKGGMVKMKPQKYNPPGPDDGYAALENGEYVIRKSAVKKYGANIFEQINAGKIPAKRLKSLLE